MPNRSEWYLEEAKKRWKLKAAKQLLVVAIYFNNTLSTRLSVSNPGIRIKRKHGKGSYTKYTNPSKPGEYPHAVTGALRKGALRGYTPTKPEEIVAAGLKIKCGVPKNVSYGLILELRMKRLGLIKTLNDIRPLLAALVKRKVS